jgi:putative glutamine amidotransferase
MIKIKKNVKSKPVIAVNLDLDERTNSLVVPFNYLLALEKAGAVPVCLPPVLSKDDLSLALQHCDGVLLIGGRDYEPQLYGAEIHEENVLISKTRQNFDIILGRHAWDHEYPVFGICGGHQLINIIAGGTLFTSIQTQVDGALVHRNPAFQPAYHKVTIDKTCRLFSGLLSIEINVNSFHHQAIKDLGAGLRIVAKTADGVIEAVESTDAPVFGIQWHPEKELDDPAQKQIFENFVSICEQHQMNRC